MYSVSQTLYAFYNLLYSCNLYTKSDPNFDLTQRYYHEKPRNMFMIYNRFLVLHWSLVNYDFPPLLYTINMII